MKSAKTLSVKTSVEHDLVSCAHLTAGLCELRAQEKIDLTWLSSPATQIGKVAPVTVRVVVKHLDHTTIRHAFDFHDVNSAWDVAALEWSDIYWKSNYHVGEVAKLEPDHRNKVRCYGLYFPTRSQHDERVYQRLIGSVRARVTYLRQKKGRVQAGDVKYAAIDRLQRYRSRLMIDEYECFTMDRPVGVYFHPGCWSMESETGRQVNQTRHELIRRLRDQFGPQFLGGFVPNQHALAHFPDDVYPHQTTHREYVQNLHRSHIVISTNGLNGCHSWRTAEAFAAGAIVVSETPVNNIDAEIVEGENFFTYTSPEECAGLCQRILTEQEAPLADRHMVAQDYYRQQLAPAPSLLRKLSVTANHQP